MKTNKGRFGRTSALAGVLPALSYVSYFYIDLDVRAMFIIKVILL